MKQALNLKAGFGGGGVLKHVPGKVDGLRGVFAGLIGDGLPAQDEFVAVGVGDGVNDVPGVAAVPGAVDEGAQDAVSGCGHRSRAERNWLAAARKERAAAMRDFLLALAGLATKRAARRQRVLAELEKLEREPELTLAGGHLHGQEKAA